MGFLKLCAVLPITENPEFKIAYPSVNQIPQSIFSFLSESYLSFYFLYHKIPLLYQRDVKIQLLQSLSCLYSRTANGSNSAPAKVIEGKLQYPT